MQDVPMVVAGVAQIAAAYSFPSIRWLTEDKDAR